MEQSRNELIFHGNGESLPIVFQTFEHPFGTNPPQLLIYKGNHFLRYQKTPEQTHYAFITPVTITQE